MYSRKYGYWSTAHLSGSRRKEFFFSFLIFFKSKYQNKRIYELKKEQTLRCFQMVEIIKRTFNPKHSYTHSHTEPNPVITIVFPVGNTIVITGFGSVCDVFCGRLRRGSNSLLVSQEELNQNLGLELHVVHVGRLVLQHLRRTRTHTHQGSAALLVGTGVGGGKRCCRQYEGSLTSSLDFNKICRT